MWSSSSSRVLAANTSVRSTTSVNAVTITRDIRPSSTRSAATLSPPTGHSPTGANPSMLCPPFSVVYRCSSNPSSLLPLRSTKWVAWHAALAAKATRQPSSMVHKTARWASRRSVVPPVSTPTMVAPSMMPIQLSEAKTISTAPGPSGTSRSCSSMARRCPRCANRS